MPQPRRIKKVADLINALNKDINDENNPTWYRGESDSSWDLLAGYDRLIDPPSETELVNKFRQNASYLIEKQSPSNDFEWLFMMQHYGVPTRLLDWSENPLMALYFAVNSISDNDGKLWLLFPHKLNANSNNNESYIPAFEEGEYLGSYTTDKYEKGTDMGILPIAAIATRNNPRIQAQMGVFTISHRLKTPIDQIGDKKHIKKYLIPKESKLKIKRELELLGFSKFTVFPELPSIGEIIKGGLQ